MRKTDNKNDPQIFQITGNSWLAVKPDYYCCHSEGFFLYLTRETAQR